jgi:hypothetical protein
MATCRRADFVSSPRSLINLKPTPMPTNTLNTLTHFTPSPGKTASYHSLAALEAQGLGTVSRLPRSLRVVLEALVRHCDGKRVTEELGDHAEAELLQVR